MESSQVFGGEEECHSSESGWTMYIGSPVQGGEDDDDYSTDHPNVEEANQNLNEKTSWETINYHHDANSDDSMASDASSGPSLCDKTWEIKKGGRHHEAKVLDRNQYSSKNKDKKPVKKNRQEKMNDIDHQEFKDEADDDQVAANKGRPKYLVQGTSKVRKNLGWGKQNK